MKKLIGVLFALVMVFALAVKVDALTLSEVESKASALALEDGRTITFGDSGNTFTVRSNKEELHLETCNKCHPFYTGVQGAVAKTGRVEKFNQKYGLNK